MYLEPSSPAGMERKDVVPSERHRTIEMSNYCSVVLLTRFWDNK